MGKTYRAGLPAWHFRGTLLHGAFKNQNFREGGARPEQNRVLLFAARTLNAAGHCRVTLSLR